MTVALVSCCLHQGKRGARRPCRICRHRNVTGIAKNQGNASGSKEKDKRMLSPKRSNSNPNNTPNPAGMRSPNQLRSLSPRSSGGMMSPGRVMSPMRTTSDSSDGMNASSSSGRGGTSGKHKSHELFNPDMYAHWGVIKRVCQALLPCCVPTLCVCVCVLDEGASLHCDPKSIAHSLADRQTSRAALRLLRSFLQPLFLLCSCFVVLNVCVCVCVCVHMCGSGFLH